MSVDEPELGDHDHRHHHREHQLRQVLAEVVVEGVEASDREGGHLAPPSAGQRIVARRRSGTHELAPQLTTSPTADARRDTTSCAQTSSARATTIEVRAMTSGASASPPPRWITLATAVAIIHA